MTARGRRARGAVAAEFVLVLPVLLTMILGIIDWGYYFCVREVAIHAAREGARFGSLLDRNEADAQARANQFLANAGYCTNGATAAAAGGAIQVTVTCPQTVVTKFFPAKLVPRTLTVRAEIRHE